MNPNLSESMRRVAMTMAMALALALAGLASSLRACSSTGVGQGALESDHTAVEFEWKSRDGGQSGTMSAWVGFGLPFRRPFEVTRATPDGLIQAGLIGELREPAPGTAGGAAPRADRRDVIAVLMGPDRQSVVCSFHVNDRAWGMSSGGKGECLLDGARRVEASSATSS